MFCIDVAKNASGDGATRTVYEAIQSAYAALSPEGHPCAGGPTFGKVVQEGHAGSGLVCLRNLHHHAACAFPQDHRWKTVEKHLREVLGIKVAGL